MAYIGSRPDNVISRNAQNEYNYTATGGQTTFTGADSNNNTLSYTPGNIEVYFNGARLEESDFTATNGTSIVLANAAVVNDELSIVAMRVFEVGSISSFNTSDLAEGTNLYFTNARADARISAADTDDLSEGSTNLYFTNARADARIAAADTDDLSEGSTNLYFTNARVAGYLSSNDFDTATNIVASITDSAPSTLDTLNELAAALGDDANFSTTVTNSIATKLPLVGGTLTGSLDVNSFQRILANNALFFMNTNNSASSYIKNTLGAGAANLRLGVMGDDKVTILSNGRVGIGTTTPGSQLTVQGTLGDGSSQAYIDGWSIIGNSYQGNIMTKLNWAGGGARIQGFNSGVQKFEISANSDTYFNGGNVGIGNTAPAGRFHVVGTGGLTGGTPQNSGSNNQIVIENNASGGSADIQMLGPTNGYNHIFFGDANDANIGVIWYNHNNNSLNFNTNANTGSMILKSDGNVGIGTSNPQKILHTYGSGAQQLRVESPDSTSELYLLASGTNTSYLSNSNNLQIWTNGGRAITVDASQRVGIGVFTPDYALDVRGGNSTSNGARIKTGDNGYDGLIVSSSSILKCYPAAGQSVSLQAYNSGGSAKTGVKVTGANTPAGEISTKLEFVTELLGHNVYDDGNYGTSSDQYVDLEDWSPADFRILEIFGTANPNSGGSALYADPVHMYVYNGSGWNGAEVTYYVYGKSVAPLARDMYGSGSGSSGNVAEVWWYNPSTTAQQDAATHGTASGYHLRLKFPNTNTITTMISLKVIKRA